MSAQPVANYDFLSYARRGAAAQLTNADPLTGDLAYRGPISVTLAVESRDDGNVRQDTAAQTVLLYGPGDVVGIDPRHIIRTEPADGTVNYEPNYLVGIEFDHPDFAWLFTPAAPSGDRLRPWLSLVVLADGEYSTPQTPPVPLPSITVSDASKLPPLDDSWAWAHVQIAGTVAADDLASVFEREPYRCLCRLLCPRRLEPTRRYTAFLVPAFELGRLAGLGVDPVLQGPLGSRPPAGVAGRFYYVTDDGARRWTRDTGAAWEDSAADPTTAPAWSGEDNVTLPYYHRFAFETSALGDFEYLVRQLQPRHLDPRVGVRPLDVTDPGWAIPSGGGPVGLTGALRPLDADTSLDVPVTAELQAKLAEYVNRGAATPPDDPQNDPVVAPPLYGLWQAAVTSVDPARTGWIDVLNTDPRHRAVGGFGTRVVLDQRTQLLTSAWRQVEGILRANQLLRQAQLARAGSNRLFAKNIQATGDDVTVALTSPVHERVLASRETVKAILDGSRLPVEAVSPAFRRATRPLGPVRARQGTDVARRSALVPELNSGELRAVPPPHPPAGLIPLEEISDRLYPAWAPPPLRALLAATLRASPRWRTAGAMRTARLTPGALESAPARPGFVIAAAGGPEAPPAGRAGGDSADARAFREAAVAVAGYLAAGAPDPPDPPAAELPRLAQTLRAQLDPAATIPARFASLVRVDGVVAQGASDDDPIAEIMAAPEFPQPMYRPLADLSQDYLLPGLERVPPNTLGLLVENHVFIEAYMVGLNHEMSRQLLFEDYPSDGRGSFFRQFWDVAGYVPAQGDPQDPAALRERLEDIPPINRWPRSNGLGQNLNRPETGDDNLVLLVRGELLRRYPNAVIYAAKARWDGVEGRHELTDEELHPLFRGTLLPDVTFFGFQLKSDEARGSTNPSDSNQGWFFVLEQHSSEPRFGLEPAPETGAQTVTKWNDLSWANFASPPFLSPQTQPSPPVIPTPDPPPPETPENPGDTDNHWGTDSGQTAFILLRRPVRVAVHARTMLPPTGGPG